MGDVSDYEKARLIRIQENQKFLLSLGNYPFFIYLFIY